MQIVDNLSSEKEVLYCGPCEECALLITVTPELVTVEIARDLVTFRDQFTGEFIYNLSEKYPRGGLVVSDAQFEADFRKNKFAEYRITREVWRQQRESEIKDFKHLLHTYTNYLKEIHGDNIPIIDECELRDINQDFNKVIGE